MSPARFRQLVAFAEDGALRADAPALPLPGREPWIAREKVWKIEIAGSDVGTRPGFDAAFLPSGLTVVALGEAGVRLISRAGRAVAELDQPAHALVVSDLADRAIALAADRYDKSDPINIGSGQEITIADLARLIGPHVDPDSKCPEYKVAAVHLERVS